MWKFSCLMISALLVVCLVHVAIGQQEGRSEQVRSNQRFSLSFDPEKFIKRGVEMVLKQMNLSKEESDTLKPKLEGFLKIRLEQNREMRSLVDALQKALEANNDELIKTKLSDIKTKRKENTAILEAQEKELTKTLTARQEAQLTVYGIINSDNVGFQIPAPEELQYRIGEESKE